MLDNIKTFIIKNKKDLQYILLLTLILLILSIPKLLIQYHVGIANWDTYLYLENGRNFAKMGWGDVQSIAPVLPMIIAKIFLITHKVDYHVIFNVDVVFYIIGVISLYLLLRYKFDYNTSLLGSIIYATFTLLYSWVAIGGNDIIGVSGTILTMYLILASNKYNNKLYILAFIIAGYSFLARYTAGVMIFAILFFLIVNRLKIKEISYLILGAIAGLISIVWFLDNFNKVLNTPFPFLEQFTGTVKNTPVLDSGYLPNPWYYIEHLPNYLSSVVTDNSFNSIVNPMGNTPTILSYIYIILMILGFISIIYLIYRKVKSNKKIKFTQKKYLMLLLAVMLFIGCGLTLNNVSYIITTIILLVGLVLLYFALEDYNIERFDYELMMFYLLLIYVIFQSILSTKNDRYFITVLPFIAYFITCAIGWIYEYIDRYKLNNNFNIKVSDIISIVLIILLVGNSLVFASSIGDENEYEGIGEASQWLENYDNITNQSIIFSDNWPAMTWYLNIFVQRGIFNPTNNSDSLLFVYNILAENDTHHAAAYYVDTHNNVKGEYKGLTKIYEKDNIVIYENSYMLGSKNKTFNSSEYKQYYDNLFANDEKFIGDLREQLKKQELEG